MYNEFNERVYSENSKGVVRRRNDEDLNESISREKMYLDKVSQLISPPYLIDLKSSLIPFKDWVKVLSLIFGRDVILDGVSPAQTNIIDSKTGEIIYLEWDYVDGYMFENRITGEFKNTLPD